MHEMQKFFINRKLQAQWPWMAFRTSAVPAHGPNYAWPAGATQAKVVLNQLSATALKTDTHGPLYRSA